MRRIAEDLGSRSFDELRSTPFSTEKVRSGLRRAEIGVHRDEVEPGVLRIVVQGVLRSILWPSYAVALAGFRRTVDGRTVPLAESDTWEFD